MFWTKKELQPDEKIGMCIVSSGSDVQAYEEAKNILDGIRRAEAAGIGESVGSGAYILSAFVMRWYPIIELLKKSMAYDESKGESS